MSAALICDAIRTPIGRFGGVLSAVRTDDLATVPVARDTGHCAPLQPRLRVASRKP